MKLVWRRMLDGRVGITANASGYDGVPWLNEFWMDASPSKLTSNRIAVAGAMIFGHQAAREIQFEKPVSAAVSEAIRQFVAKPNLNVFPVDYEQRPFPAGKGKLVVRTVDDVGGALSFARDESEGMILNVLPADQFTGRLYSVGSLSVASNAFLFDRTASARGERTLAALAMGVLFAEDLGVDCCELQGHSVDSDVLELLISCGLAGG